MNSSQIIASVLFANGLSLTIWYSLWRIKKNERDLKAIALFVFCCIIGALIVLTARSS